MADSSSVSNKDLVEDTERKSKYDEKLTVGGVPFHRRRETFAVMMFFFMAPLCGFLSFLIVRFGSWYIVYPFLLYVTYIFLFQTFHRDGGRPSKLVRSSRFWTWFRNYFPITLHKTVDLDPSEKYIFGYHPHGIISLGAFVNFGTEATHWSEMFPGVDNRLLTLRMNFFVPFYGLYLSLLGLCDASKESINAILGKGGSVTLVLGGAKESLEARPGVATLHLKNRKGFVKMGLLHGASLVPVYSFGENDLFDQADNPKGSPLRNLQDKLQSKLGFALPFVKGRAVFNPMAPGMLPQRHPVNTVVGAPIKLPKLSREEITGEIINQYHTQYLDDLKALYDKYKDVYEPKRKQSIAFT